eukprot:6333835-Prymnesium_polylepis.1
MLLLPLAACVLLEAAEVHHLEMSTSTVAASACAPPLAREASAQRAGREPRTRVHSEHVGVNEATSRVCLLWWLLSCESVVSAKRHTVPN